MASVPAPAKSAEAPWHAAYPAVKAASILTITCKELLHWYEEGKKPGLDFVLVDLRRADHEGGTIKGSINLPAQSLYPSLPTLYTLFSEAKIPYVIWYCGSSKGRGNRAAGWFADHLSEKAGNKMQSMVLVGGIQEWVNGGEEFTKLVEEYQAEIWRKRKLL